MAGTVRHMLCVFLLILPAEATGNPGRQAALLRGIHLTLDEAFTDAHAVFDSLAAAEPDRPEPPFYKAMAYWRKGLNLEGGPAYDSDVRTLLRRAIGLAEAHIKAHGESGEMYFWLGNAYGVRTGLEMLRKNVLRGAMDGYQGRECLFEAVRLDTSLVDPRFGIGLSDYFLSQQLRILRMAGRLLSLPSGDREGGLEQLDRAARDGVYCQMDALSARAFIALYYEHDHEDARRRVAELLGRFPNSLDYRIRYADALLYLTIEQGQDHRRALIDSVGSIRRIAGARGDRLKPWRRSKLVFTEGMAHYLLGDRDRAQALMTDYLREADPKSWLRGPAELVLGKLADLKADRTRALAHYRRVLKCEDVWASRAEAKRYREQPFSGEEPARRPPDRAQRYPEMP